MSTLRTNVFSALKNADDFNDNIEAIRKDPAVAAVITDREAVRALLLPHVAAKRGCPIVDGQRKAKGTKVLDSDAPNYNTTKSDLDRLVKSVMGVTASKTEQYEIPEEMLAAALKLVKLAKGYDEKIMRSLAAQALAHAWTADAK